MSDEGSVLELTSCISEGNTEDSFRAHHHARMTLTGCSSTATTQNACNATSGAQLKAENVVVCNSGGYGFSVEDGAKADLVSCSATKSEFSGVLVSGRVTAAQLNNCIVSSNKMHGVEVCDHAVGKADKCSFAGNGGSGVYVEEQGVVEAKGCSSEGNKERGFWAEEKGRITVLDCSSTYDAWQGCGGRSGGRMSADNVTVRNSGRSGFRFENAVAVLKACSCFAAEVHGVCIEGKGTTVEMYGGTVSQNGEAGVCVLGGAEARVDDVMAVGNRTHGFLCDGEGEGKASKLVLLNCECQSSQCEEVEGSSSWVRSMHLMAANKNRAFLGRRKGMLEMQGCSSVGGAEWHGRVQVWQWWLALLWRQWLTRQGLTSQFPSSTKES